MVMLNVISDCSECILRAIYASKALLNELTEAFYTILYFTVYLLLLSILLLWCFISYSLLSVSHCAFENCVLKTILSLLFTYFSFLLLG